MKLPYRFAAIDIGSNAVRLLLSNVIEENEKVHFHKLSLIRVPVRLGSDTFVKGGISDERKEDLVRTMIAYSNLMSVYKVEDYMAYATSAMREATNGQSIVDEVFRRSGVPINIIDGEMEAKVIHATHVAEEIGAEKSYLYIDVGGGSTELTLFTHGEYVAARSFKIGTIRLLEDIVAINEWKEMQGWIAEKTRNIHGMAAIGTGGNINKLFKLIGAQEGKPITFARLEKCQKYLETYSYEERVNILGLRDDRADVIVPAASIYLYAMKCAGIRKMYVPKLGLVDGMVHILYEKRKLSGI